MDKPARDLSRLIDGYSRALAEYTVTRHTEIDPGLSERYGDGWRPIWVGDTKSRLAYLAQAIAIRRPSLFASAIRWKQAAFAARNVRTEDLRNSLVALREVLETELPSDAARIALPYVDEAISRLDKDVAVPPTHLDASATHAETLLRYLESVLSGHAEEAVQAVLDAADSGVPVQELYEGVIEPAQAEVGRMWHLGEISIADEHYATGTTSTAMSRLRAYFPERSPSERRVVAFSVGGDLHEIGIRMVADFFEMDGWSVYCIGANVPVDDVLHILRERSANLVAISAGTSLHLRAIGDLIDAVRSAPDCKSVKIIVGGPAFLETPDAWKEIGADGYAATAHDAVQLGNQLVPNPSR